MLVSQLDSDDADTGEPEPVSNLNNKAQSAGKPSESVLSDKPSPATVSQSEQAIALVEALRQEQQQAEAVELQPVVEEVPLAPVEVAPVIKPRQLTAQQKALAVVQKARGTDFFVQHIVLSEEIQADLYRQRYSGLGAALVLPIETPTSVAYAVISGPFTSRERAEKFAKGTGRPADYWIRGALQLEAALDSN